MIVVSSCSCSLPIHWSQVSSWEWRRSWSSADRRCFNYIWVINNYITTFGATYIRGLTVLVENTFHRKGEGAWYSIWILLSLWLKLMYADSTAVGAIVHSRSRSYDISKSNITITRLFEMVRKEIMSFNDQSHFITICRWFSTHIANEIMLGEGSVFRKENQLFLINIFGPNGGQDIVAPRAR